MRLKYLLIYLQILIMMTNADLYGKENLEKVDLQLRWLHQFQFAGFYAAEELGYYEDAGFDVKIIPGGPGTDVVKEVMNGNADFGVQTPSILVDRANGYPVVVLAAIFQHSPVALVVNKDSGIDSPFMLAGKKIMLGQKNVELRAMLINESLIDKVEIHEFTGDYKELIDKEVDGISGYITDLSYLKDQGKNTFNYIRPITYGIDFYGDCLFTSEKEIEQDPSKVTAFREASLRGWKYAMENPEKIIDVILRKYNSDSTRNRLFYEYTQMKKLMHADIVEVGHMNPGRWDHISETFQTLGLIQPGFELQGFLYTDYFNNDRKNTKILLSVISIILFFLVVISWRKFYLEKRKEADEILKHRKEIEASEARFRGLIEFGADGILLGSPEGNIIEVNEMACKIIGTKREELVGKFVTAVPFTKESLKKAPLRFDLLKEGKIVLNERDIVRRDGTTVNIEMKTKMMTDGTFQSIFRDITEKKNTEKELESINSRFEYVLGATKTGFDIIDEENDVIYVDPKWAQKLGDFRGKKCFQYFMGKKKPCLNCAIPEALKTGNTTISEEYLEKENRFIEVHTISLNEKINGKRLVAEFNIDITERKSIEKKLKEFNMELEKKVAERTSQLELANRELESFSYSVSHDLRAPVRHIIGFTDIFMKENTDIMDDRSKDTFSKITSSAHRMERLIDDLLKLSRTGRKEMTFKRVNMEKIIKNVMSEYKDCKEHKQVKSTISSMPEVCADLNLITLVWENLIDNACKYTKNENVVKIDINCREENDEYVFRIKDNGVGFDPEFSHKLFGVFQRLHLAKDFPGTGIGLANVRRIISRHGGRTWAESQGEGKGAVFYFSLPKN